MVGDESDTVSDGAARGGVPGLADRRAGGLVTMTGPAPVPPLPAGPPFSADAVADVHAGVYPDAVTSLLRQRIAADPEAAALLAALDATVDDLASWQTPAPVPMPAVYATRLTTAIADEAAARAASGRSEASAGRVLAMPVVRSTGEPGPDRAAGGTGPGRVSSLDEVRSRRSRRWAMGLGAAAAIAAVVTIGAVVLRPSGGDGGLAGQAGTTTGTTVAPTTSAPGSPAPTQQAIVADPKHLEKLLSQITGTATAGPYSDPARLSACLQANGVKGTNVLGVAAVTYQGAPAYAISLGLDEATAKILVVGASCGDPGPDLVASQTTGR